MRVIIAVHSAVQLSGRPALHPSVAVRAGSALCISALLSLCVLRTLEWQRLKALCCRQCLSVHVAVVVVLVFATVAISW